MKVWQNVGSGGLIDSEIVRCHNLPDAAVKVLSGMGLSGSDEIKRFLYPRLNDIADPYLLPSMDLAVSRIWKAVDDQETIAIHGDYDVDGITSAGLLTLILRRLGAGRVHPFLPSRIDDGYGFSVDTLKKCVAEHKPSLVITVDCGTNSESAVAAAAADGIDVIVTDHHEAAGSPCSAHAVINPKIGDNESFKILAGVGVAFKLCHALIKRGRINGKTLALKADLRDYLEWVALGTVADIVPLLGENRILVKHGLAKLNATCSPGLRALIKIAGIKGSIGSYHIGYLLAPRLNAAGRIDNPADALELLLTEDSLRAKELAKRLDETNRERQISEAEIQQQAENEIKKWFDPAKHFGIVVGNREWHPGVIGIVASRLATAYRRPTAVISFDKNGLGRGSCRSIEGYNLLTGLEKCAGHLLKFGGHAMAAGLEVEEDKFEGFKAAFNEEVMRELKGRNLDPVQTINAWIKLNEVNDSLLECLDKFGPFGHGNPMPVFASSSLEIVGRPCAFGKNHLRMTLASKKTSCDAIAFGMAKYKFPEGRVDAAFRLQRYEFARQKNIQLIIQDIRASK